jgi:hypothetical protein
MKLAYESFNGYLGAFNAETNDMDRDRRRNRRRPLELSVYCQKVGATDGRLFSGNTVNVSPSGVLVKMQGPILRDGELVSVEMAVPPSDGLLDNSGRFSSYARVVRIDDPSQRVDSGKEVALEFCESPRFRY